MATYGSGLTLIREGKVLLRHSRHSRHSKRTFGWKVLQLVPCDVESIQGDP